MMMIRIIVLSMKIETSSPSAIQKNEYPISLRIIPPVYTTKKHILYSNICFPARV